MKQFLRFIPPVHEFQRDGRFVKMMSENGIDLNHVTNLLKEVIEEVREELMNESWEGHLPGTAEFSSSVFELLEKKIQKQYSYTLARVINSTGTILHTNLGRARLSDEAARHVLEIAMNYSNLEYSIEKGERGSRHSHAESLIKKITGAEAAMVVNNNAAAVYLILRALANEKEVIVSRGQLVEIGGSFRISSIMEESGAKLIEVGTTNKTHLYDYENAITENTAMILKVHTSNFKVIGFTKSVETEELASLKKQYPGVIFYEDLGSGALYDFQKHGIGEEPVVSEVLKKGADLVSFSGDKLLGGPQAGIIAGKKELIDRLKKHQLARVVRVDKMTLAALEGTLLDYLKGEDRLKQIPVVRDLLVPIDVLEKRAKRFLDRLSDLSEDFFGKISDATSQVGGGTMPDVELPTKVITLTHSRLSAESVARKLRMESTPPIIVRIQKDEIHLDLRTVTEEEETVILNALANI
ncbi:L-seryl-tRNA(Sec) selenium transferase [Bacillus methanolicus]|uniref:L-seryl-tRNA(Sec) selenium transferase n=1 Tax=Bacillus methanolicus TaxID=1471 RepID=UPI002380B0CA|nr:L-seryl-tRNA(Sec) selenium transferase [Bacillus methanolicus]MDE3838776.1 L-seryl-tRNA(Sec) selenium transferase [Bacillus methanolicus]